MAPICFDQEKINTAFLLVDIVYVTSFPAKMGSLCLN